MTNLERITSEYIESEDRIRLTGRSGARETVILWITQRLLSRLLAHFFSWLEKEAPEVARSSVINNEAKAALQEMAQESAAAALKEQSAVTATPNSAAWLVNEIDIKMGEEAVQLVFKCDDGRKAELGFTIQQLRQWLRMVYSLWQQAEWPVSIWPDWMDAAQQATSATPESSVH